MATSLRRLKGSSRTHLLSVRPAPQFSPSETTYSHRLNPAKSRRKIAQEENQLGQYIPIHYHYNMLQDQVRVNMFKSAIEANVRPGMHVVELGGGTGILSSFAARCGARVTCVERNPELVHCTKRLLKLNGLDGQVEVIASDARQYIPSQPVDAVICEMLHVGLLREKQLRVIDAFKHNYLSAIGGQLPSFFPEASVLAFQAVEHPFEFAGYQAPVPLFQAPNAESLQTKQLSQLEKYGTVIYDQHFSHRFQCNVTIEISETGSLNALRFITQNLIAIDQEGGLPFEWPNQFLVLPLDKPFDVQQGDRIRIRFRYEAGASLNSLSQSLRISRAVGVDTRQSVLKRPA